MLRLNQSVKNKKRSSVSTSDGSAAVKKTLQALEKLSQWARDIKPVEQKNRFGNSAFRAWHARLRDQAAMLIGGIVGSAAVEEGERREGGEREEGGKVDREGVVEELAEYLKLSFGNETRIDYGSGHEAMFLVLMFCLWKVGVYSDSDDADLVLLVFVGYLEVTRLLQKRYMLEPAGSHGVWGLDDYSFLPFLWGSAQLLNSKRVVPGVVSDEVALRNGRDEYLYLDAIAYIREMKRGPFHEHSPMLWDISQVKEGWPKINQGMIKMYKGEVWNKRPVIQHLVFGSVFPFAEKGEKKDEGEKTCKMAG